MVVSRLIRFKCDGWEGTEEVTFMVFKCSDSRFGRCNLRTFVV